MEMGPGTVPWVRVEGTEVVAGGAGGLAMGNKLRGNAIDGRDGWLWVKVMEAKH
jgi:hypothetical protein